MTDLLIAAVLLLAGGGAHWLVRDLRGVPAAGGCGGARDAAATVSVVIPARDEATTLPRLLASLQGLSAPVGEVIVVDDGSRDATGAVAREAGARVLPAGTPPPGWTGKAWACHVGARASTGELLLFLDADTVLAPDALGGLLRLRGGGGGDGRETTAGRAGLVSVQPFHTVVRPYEQLSAYFNLVSVTASAAFTRRPGRRSLAFGPCLLTSRRDYERAGGHAAVRGEILDDARLAAAYQRAGLPVRCAVGGRSIRMRSYPGGVRQLVDGWTKNVASGASAAAPRATLATVLWVGAHHAIAVGAVLAVVSGLTPGDGVTTHGAPPLWAVAWVAAAWQLRAILHRVGSFRWWTWVLFPVPLLAFDAVFALSALRTVGRRSVRWRGREVDLRRRRSVEGGR
jgi:4,4'-diaponeurosporenoate glycosyltransferase